MLGRSAESAAERCDEMPPVMVQQRVRWASDASRAGVDDVEGPGRVE